MPFSLSTSYFAGREWRPETCAAFARELGFAQVELGYFTREGELGAWERALAEEGLSVSSVHAFCPVPLEMPQLGPEAFSLASLDALEREVACTAMRRTLDCAQAFGARAVVVHGGRVPLRKPGMLFGAKPYRSQLEEVYQAHGVTPGVELVEQERLYRSSMAPRLLDALSFSLERLLPLFEGAGVVLAFENLPGLEAFPDPAEVAFLRSRFPSEALGAWYDVGHGERKARSGDWEVEAALEQTLEMTVGVHIHDVRGRLEDHRAPGEGEVDFGALRALWEKRGLLHVFEPSPEVTPEALRRGVEIFRTATGIA